MLDQIKQSMLDQIKQSMLDYIKSMLDYIKVQNLFQYRINNQSNHNIIVKNRMMNLNYKLRTRNTKQQPSNRRIKTEANQNTNNTKKISFYLSKPIKQPLQQNKKLLNQTQTIQQSNPYSQIKKVKPFKSIATKIAPVSKLTTEPYEKSGIISLGQRQAIDKIFQTGKAGIYANRSSDLYLKKNVPPKELPFKQTKDKKQQKISLGKDFLKLQTPIEGPTRYVFEDKVGAGTFGIVHKARDKRTLEIVAIKRVFQDKKYKNRELQILKTLNHPNALKMKDCFYTYEGDKEYLNVVMDYFDLNLYESIQKYRTKGGEMPRLKVKVFAFQLFRSLLYLNKISIAHRDIKPQNILVKDTNLKLVMCDFGSAKQLKPGEPNIAYICSRCYRAPELIFGNANYTTQIDMWSAGCVLVEMITMEPVFRAESNIDQLVEIIKILGTPTYSEMLEMNPECDFQKYKLPKIGAKTWEKVIKRKNLGEDFVDLVKKVLQYSPLKRLTPFEALLHPFFDELRNEQTYMKLKKEYNIPELFDFQQTREVDLEKIGLLVPQWHQKM